MDRMSQEDRETLAYIKSRLGGVDYEDIRKEFDWLLLENESRLRRIDKLERRLSKYEQVHITCPTDEEIQKNGLYYYFVSEDRE